MKNKGRHMLIKIYFISESDFIEYSIGQPTDVFGLEFDLFFSMLEHRNPQAKIIF